MRIVVAILLAAVVALTVEVIRLESRLPSAAQESAGHGVPSERAVSPAARESPDPSTALLERLRSAETRVADLSNEVEALRRDVRHESRESAVASTPPAPSEEEFRRAHEATILRILAEERDRQAFETVASELRSIVRTFAEEQRLDEDARARIGDSIVEAQKRRSEILMRLAPDGKWPGDDDPRRAEWQTAWAGLREWRRGQLGRFLQADQIETLLKRTRSIQQF